MTRSRLDFRLDAAPIHACDLSLVQVEQRLAESFVGEMLPRPLDHVLRHAGQRRHL